MENNSTKKFEDALHLLNEAARDKKGEIQNLIGDKYSEIRDLIQDASAKGRREIRRVKQTAEDILGDSGDNLKRAAQEFEDNVRENPLPYLGGIAVGALLLGFILGSSSRNK